MLCLHVIPNLLNRSYIVVLIHTLVISRLDDCNAQYMGLPLKITQKLQLWNAVACYLGWMDMIYITSLKADALAGDLLLGSIPSVGINLESHSQAYISEGPCMISHAN